MEPDSALMPLTIEWGQNLEQETILRYLFGLGQLYIIIEQLKNHKSCLDLSIGSAIFQLVPPCVVLKSPIPLIFTGFLVINCKKNWVERFGIKILLD